MNRLWAFVFRRWLWSDWHQCYGTVVRVKGWRTALVEWHGNRQTISPCFWWFR